MIEAVTGKRRFSCRRFCIVGYPAMRVERTKRLIHSRIPKCLLGVLLETINHAFRDVTRSEHCQRRILEPSLDHGLKDSETSKRSFRCACRFQIDLGNVKYVGKAPVDEPVVESPGERDKGSDSQREVAEGVVIKKMLNRKKRRDSSRGGACQD